MSNSKAFDVAAEKFMGAFFKMHPKQTLPEWFPRYTACGGQKGLDGNWTFAITAIPAATLRPGQTWEPDKRGGYSLISTDPDTGVRSAIISTTATKSDVLKIFEAWVDCETSAISILVDSNIDDLSVDELLPLSQKR